jgi:hypothetical protein
LHTHTALAIRSLIAAILKRPLKKEAEATQIALGIFVKIESMKSVAETRF